MGEISDCCSAKVYNPGGDKWARCEACHEMSLVISGDWGGTRQKVAVLGSGASAAFAVAACKSIGAEVKVYSSVYPTENVQQTGAYFLHAIPPNIGHVEPVQVSINSIGEAAVYSEMQWGEVVPTSFPIEERTELWYSPMYLNRVWQSVPVFRETLSTEDIIGLTHQGYDWVFHSFPLVGRHESLVQFPIVVGKQANHLRDFILYNGTVQYDWVRATRQFGNLCFEYPHTYSIDDEYLFRDVIGNFSAPPLAELMGDVPASYEFFCGRDILPSTRPVTRQEYVRHNIVPIGRFATWDRKAFAHHAYTTVESHLQER